MSCGGDPGHQGGVCSFVPFPLQIDDVIDEIISLESSYDELLSFGPTDSGLQLPSTCLLDLAVAEELPPGLGLPLGLGGPDGTFDDILMDEGGALSPLGPPGTLLASPGPSRASSPRSSLSMEDEP
ncbi:hypothetical protein AAES_41077 [Amazona aestiva]|uniref:MiT/TFE transcription factors C-terminal domain-containing protein n=1 Tax=Amazona aestiva TaxID=12930 RepID=A0A0Q3MSB2_AMAAE|nr:hypothetical protein AAES_41077 [Amazona aestiva]